MKYLEHSVYWMQKALVLAEQAGQQGEVPVGALLVKDNHLLAAASNATIQQCNPIAHAEMLVLQEAALGVGHYRLQETTLYVTLEPCIMCLGAIIESQVQRVIFGAYDAHSGAAGTMFDLMHDKTIRCYPDIIGGLYAQASSQLLKAFFKKQRSTKSTLQT